MIQTRKIVMEGTKSDSDHLPTITKWKKVSMIRVHSMRASVKEIIQTSKNKDVVKIGIIGEPDTGKSTQADTIAHLIHTMSDIPFAVRSFEKEELVDIKKTLASLDPANYILKFGDLSWLSATASKRQIDELKESLTKIRHLPGGKDVKMIMIYDYHYTKALDPYLRQSEFKYFTGMGSSEKKNMEEAVGKNNMGKMLMFKKMCTRMTAANKFTFKLGNKGYFIYKFRDPFIPMLFWNEDTLRFVVSPTRHWIDQICSICSLSDNSFESEIDIEKLINQGNVNFGPGNFEAAVKLKLFTNGMNVYAKHVTNASKWLDRALETKKISLEDIAAKFNFTLTQTRLRKKMDGVLSD